MEEYSAMMQPDRTFRVNVWVDSTNLLRISPSVRAAFMFTGN